MQIRKATYNDLPIIMEIYDIARQTMRRSGNPEQWRGSYPSQQIVEDDIANGNCHVCTDNDEVLGVFFFLIGHEPTYDIIYDGKWIDDDKYGVIHRIASSGKRKGVGSYCIEWCCSQFPNIRIDTHSDNAAMHHILTKLGFKYCGIIHLENGEERMAYQYVKI